MHQPTVILITLLSFIHLISSQDLLLSQTSCLSNCLSCSQNLPLQCDFQPSPIVNDKNLNCLPFYEGNNCNKVSPGLYVTSMIFRKASPIILTFGIPQKVSAVRANNRSQLLALSSKTGNFKAK